MKRLIIYISFALLLVFLEHGFAQSVNKKTEAQNSQEVTQPSPIPRENGTTKHNNASANPTDGKETSWLFWLTVILALAGTIQAWAAVRSAEALRNGDRAWILVENIE